MNKKYIVIAASCLFLLAAGVCYSYFYGKNHNQETLLTSIEKDNTHIEDELLAKANKDIENDFDISNKLQSNGIEQSSDIEDELENNMIYVHICGAVVNPDVYPIEAGARLVDLIEEAGGLIPEAAGDYINQAMVAEDGQRIYIPTKDELSELTAAEYLIGETINNEDSQSEDKATGKVNINTADEKELMSLPGIGQAKAKGIIDYRSKKGNFKAITNLMDVPGIKEGLFSQIEARITVISSK